MDMDLESAEQSQSLNSDFFTDSRPLLVWSRIHIERLPESLLLDVMKFLGLQDIFCCLPLASREFHSLIAKNHMFRKVLFSALLKRTAGLVIPQESQISEELLMKQFTLRSTQFGLIPFYGYATNAGFDQLQEYYIDTAFLRGLWSVCSKESSKNINIAGGILNDQNNHYATYIKNYKNISQVVDSIAKYIQVNFHGETFPLDYVKRVYFKFSLEENEEITKLYEIQAAFNDYNNSGQSPTFQHAQMLPVLKIATDLFQKISLCKTMHLPVQERYIEDKLSEFNENSIQIITGMELSREGYFSCPVRTVMVFGSNSRIQVENNPELDQFNDIAYDEQVEGMVNKLGLGVADTNLRVLRSKTLHFDDQNDFKFVVFKRPHETEQICTQNKETPQDSHTFHQSGQIPQEFLEPTKQTVFPIAWIQFFNPAIKHISIQFKKLHYFSCKYVSLKLIDCDNCIEEPERQLNPNIDFNYLQFKGISIQL